MAQPITKKDLKDALSGLSKRFEARLDGVGEGLRRDIRDVRSDLRKETRELLAESSAELLKAISELILNDKIATLETEVEGMKSRLSVLESAR